MLIRCRSWLPRFVDHPSFWRSPLPLLGELLLEEAGSGRRADVNRLMSQLELLVGKVDGHTGSMSQAPASLIEAAARRASPLLSNLMARSRSPQRTGTNDVSHMMTGSAEPVRRSSLM